MKNYTPTVLQRNCPLSASHGVPKEDKEVGLGPGMVRTAMAAE